MTRHRSRSVGTRLCGWPWWMENYYIRPTHYRTGLHAYGDRSALLCALS